MTEVLDLTASELAVRRPRRFRFGSIGWIGLAVAVTGLVGMPTFQIIRTGVRGGSSTVTTARHLPGIGETLIRTLYLGLGSATLALSLGVLLAWWVSRLSGRLRVVAGLVPVLPVLVPAPVMVVGWTFLLSPRVGYANQLLRKLPFLNHLETGPIDVYTTPWIILLTALILTPFAFFFVNGALETLGSDYEAAAAVSGARPRRAFFTIMLPLLRPSLVYAFAIVLVLGAGQFTAPLLLGRQQGVDVLTTEIYKLTERFPVQYALGSVLGSPLLALGLLVVVLQRRAIGDQRRFVTGRDRDPVGGSNSAWRLAPLALYAGVLLLPLLAIIHVAFSPFWSGEFTFKNYTMKNFDAVLGDDRVMNAFKTSIWAAFVAILIIVPLTFFAALALAPGSNVHAVLRNVIDFVVNMPVGIPATVFGFGVLLSYTQSPFRFYGSITVVIIVYVTIMLPFATRLQLAALMSQGLDYREASAVSGARPWRTVVKIIAPLARAGIVSATLLTFILLMHEFSASLMVRAPQTVVVGALLYEFYSQGNYAKAAVFSLLIVVVTGMGVLLARILGGGKRAPKASTEPAAKQKGTA